MTTEKNRSLLLLATRVLAFAALGLALASWNSYRQAVGHVAATSARLVEAQEAWVAAQAAGDATDARVAGNTVETLEARHHEAMSKRAGLQPWLYGYAGLCGLFGAGSVWLTRRQRTEPEVA